MTLLGLTGTLEFSWGRGLSYTEAQVSSSSSRGVKFGFGFFFSGLCAVRWFTGSVLNAIRYLRSPTGEIEYGASPNWAVVGSTMSPSHSIHMWGTGLIVEFHRRCQAFEVVDGV